MSALLLKNIYHLYQGDGEGEHSGYDLLVQNNLITTIGKGLAAPPGARVIDCSHHVVIPGMVNTHHHFYQALTRNIPEVQNAKLFDWLVHLYEIWKHVDAEAVSASSLLAMGELLKTGCTLTTDHHYLYPRGISADIMALQFEAADTLGMRFSPSRGSMSLSRKNGGLPPDSVVQDASVILEDSLRVIEQFHDTGEFAMRKVVLSPCSPFSVTPDLMKESAKLARSYGVRLHTHLAETADEDDYCMQVLGKRPLAYMEECGFIGEDVFYAHGIHFTDSELKLLSETGTRVAHCPSSNMRLGSGICRVREMLDLGMKPALAVDGSASNDSGDMLGEVRNAMLLQRVRYGSGGLTAREAFAMATVHGAQLLNFPRTGKLLSGWTADIAVFDVRKLEYAGTQSDPLASLIFAGYNHGCEYTIVNGKVVVEHNRLIGCDEEELLDRAHAAAARLLEEHP